MTHSLTEGRLAVAAWHAEAALAVHAPELVGGFTSALPAAADIVGRKLRGALVREDIGDARARNAGQGAGYAFDRVEFAEAGADDPVELLAGLDAPGFAAELRNAVINLAVAMARPPAGAPGDDPDEAAIALERLAVAGHNLHPCGRTRLGWDTTDVLAYDLEAGATEVGFVAVRDDGHLGDDVGAALSAAYPHLPEAPPGFRLQPVHPWQRDSVLPDRYGDLILDGALRILDATIEATPTAALRTLLLPAGVDGRRRYLKVSLDIQVTSTRRSISVASTRNGPAVSALLHRLAADEPRLILLAETAGAAVPAGSGRDMSAILRDGLTGRLAPGEVAVPGGAIPAELPRLLAAYGRPPLTWLAEYAELLLPPLLRWTALGVAFEAHLQNCLPTFVRGTPTRLVLRDFAGLRLHLPRLSAAGHSLQPWPGSVIGTDDEDVLRAKIGYTALQAHLGELIIHLPVDESAAWRVVRQVVDQTYEAMGGTPVARRDHAAFTAARVPHKALVRMRLGGAGDVYIPVRNPLHATA
ncbi:IucA/IucC family protein [Actinoplanes sp. NBRC 103695]|uniref:IucA/IucC family protein n=1 Tax=Actinoplanes sp. NBRC 103695 TaxID=3032202 RepID=UPI0024A34CF1|nr:IucA/IucC family protein [Actinoplanes sp. NBRC 103695]GLY95089.1 iron transporter [Actinoplanes sp. NBRC 103695]